ncbi:hypothetical protein CL657_04455 [bacterium]|nr:hypothetical protein [bacterium]
MIDLIFQLYVISSFWMVVTILFVQLVHYPLFQLVDMYALKAFSLDHQRRISWMVVPAMICEFLSLFYLMISLKTVLFYLSFAVLVLIWLITFTVQVPIHQKLITRPSKELTLVLVNSNWYRTFLWCLKGILLIVYYGI